MAIDYKSSLPRYRKYITAIQKQPLWQASLILIFSLGLLIILLVLVLRPTLITISTLLGQIDTQRRVEEQLDAKIALIQQTQQLLSSIQTQLVHLDNSLPITPNLGAWAQAVQTVASGSGVVVTDITLSDIPLTHLATASATLASLEKIDFEIQATADYSQLVNFIDTLERLPRLAILNSVQFNQRNTGQLEMVVSGTISFAYAQKDN